MKGNPSLQSKTVGFVVALAGFFLILALPSLADMNPAAKRMAAVTFLMAVLWISEAIPIAATALLPLPLFPLLKILPSKAVAPNYTNHLVFLFLGGFMIAAAMQRWQLHRRVALVTISLIGHQPRRLVFGFMLATALLSMWISNTATAMMMLPIAMAITAQFHRQGEARQKSFGLILMLAIAYGASIGGCATLVGTPPNIVFSGLIEKIFPQAPAISFAQWMRFALPFSGGFLIIAWFYLCYVVGRKSLGHNGVNGDADFIKKELSKLGALGYEEKRVLVIFVTTALLWIFRRPLDFGALTLPGWSQLLPFGGYIHDATVAMAMGLLLFFLPGKTTDEGEEKVGRQRLLTWDYFERSTSWGILLLFGGGFALAHGFAESGLAVWLAGKLQLLAGMPKVLLILSICLFITFLTELTSNTATATIILPVLAALAVAIEVHPLLLMVPATISASCAFMLPVATPPNAIVFGSGFVTIPKMARAGLWLNLLGALLLTVLAWLLLGPAFSIDNQLLPQWAR